MAKIRGMNTIIHEVDCPGCGVDLTQEDSVKVHFSADGHEFDRFSSVAKDGFLYDPTDVELISKGFHAGSSCAYCDKQLEELIADDLWYVAYGAKKSIAGPFFSHAIALSHAENEGGMPFSDRIFSPQFVTTPEVEKLLGEMRSKSTDCITVTDVTRGLLQRAIDTITLLSREKSSTDVTEIVGRLLRSSADAEKVAGFVELTTGEVQEIVQKLTCEKLVTGHIEGGVFNLGDVPAGVEVDIRDYDIDGVDAELLREDEKGDKYFNAG